MLSTCPKVHPAREEDQGARRPNASSSIQVEERLRAILFWGAMSLLLGVLGTTVGIVQMTRVIEMMGRVGGALVLEGIGVTLITSIFGLLIFLVSAVLWFLLRRWHLRRTGRSGRTDLIAV